MAHLSTLATERAPTDTDLPVPDDVTIQVLTQWHALRDDLGVEIDVVDCSEHALGAGSDVVAVSYVETSGLDGTLRWGVGTDPSIIGASFRAMLSALHRQVELIEGA